MDTFMGLMIAGFLGFIIGGVAALVDCGKDYRLVREQIAKGEIACEYYRSELICWNPKEEGE